MYAKFDCIEISKGFFNEINSPDVVSCNVMLGGYVCGWKVTLVQELFDKMSERDLVLWNTMIHGYDSSGELGGKKSFSETRSP